jgi:nicotinamidase/pyrazinamidase
MQTEILHYPGGTISKDKVLSLDVDAEKGFTPLCPNELPVPQGHLIDGELNLQAGYARYLAVSKDAHPRSSKWAANEKHQQLDPITGEPDMDVHWNLHTLVGEYGHELIPELPHMREYDFWAIKGTEPDMHPYGACYQDLDKRISTGLIEWAIVKGVKVVIVGGLALDYCVAETVRELLAAGFVVILNLGATRAISEDGGRATVEELRSKGAVIINSAAELTVD